MNRLDLDGHGQVRDEDHVKALATIEATKKWFEDPPRRRGI